MPKPHYKIAPPHVVRRLEACREVGVIIESADGRTSWSVPAAGILDAMGAAQRAGYYWPPEDVPTPILTALDALEKAGDQSAVSTFRVQNSMDLEFEQKCLALAKRLKAWSEQPSEEELAKIAQAKREAAEREAAIESRAQELLTTENAKRLETARARARKELEPGGSANRVSPQRIEGVET